MSVSISLSFVIIGFLVLYFANVYYLTYIAIIYIASAVLLLVLNIICLNKKSEYKVNFFKIIKISYTKKKWGILLINFSVEFVWQIGYYATSLFLLKKGDQFLNTYSYLENVLDIFNGFLFSYITITSINITRALGQDKFDEAYMHARYSIYGAIILWAFYFVMSLILMYPIALGVNSEYFRVMFTVLPCYVAMHFFRFLTWNFSSYMLRQGGKGGEVVAVEILSSIYMIVLCVVAPYLPASVPLVYLFITIPDIIALPIYFIVFKRKKWLCNVNNDANSLANKIKCFIFDFDDTLYYGVDWSEWHQQCKDWYKEHFSSLNEKELRKLTKQAIGRGKIHSGVDVAKALKKIEGSPKAWLDLETN